MSGTDIAGNPVSLTTSTDQFGLYDFTQLVDLSDLEPGTYEISINDYTVDEPYIPFSSNAGTIG